MLDFDLRCALIVAGSNVGCADGHFTSSDYLGVSSSDQFAIFAPLFSYMFSKQSVE